MSVDSLSPRVMIVVTHLLGIGHLARMAAVGREMARQGWTVTLVSGGRPAATVNTQGCTLVQLPPVHCVGSDFSTLYQAPGVVADADHFLARREALLATLDATRPEALITELFPFGRRTLGDEFLALLEHAHAQTPRPAILCSIRDVLNPPSKPGRAEEAEARLAAFYDGILFHGASEVVPLDASWPASRAVLRRVLETGYVHDGSRSFPDGGTEGAGEIIVSGGGSEAGLPLSENALDAARGMPDKRWRLLVGAGVPAESFERLRTRAPANMIVERARPDFPALLGRAALSISQAGYNTVLDLAAANARAILVPFAEGGEREQGIRARELQRRGLAHCLETATLTPDALAGAARDLLAAPRPDWSAIGRDGAARTAEEVSTAIDRRRAAMEGWARLDTALKRARDAGRTLDFWWRDDDAVDPSAALDTLLTRFERFGVSGGLAIIPSRATPALVERLRAAPAVDVLIHGWAHTNYAPVGEKAAEFGAHRPPDIVAGEAGAGLSRLRELFGERALPLFVPPWNRIASAISAALPAQGFTGLSTFTRRSGSIPGLTQLNTHWDPIAWKRSGGLVDEAKLANELARLVEDELAAAPGELEPIGLLTHHLVHDGWIDRLLDEVMERLAASGVVRFVSARDMLAQAGAR
ncbi:glycosyl transferase family 28 [Ancylobacter sp. A5.8]|uniref:glycosyltransferase n=1 Tax=Ancylobacter gelatini TaxID=2919920 RepID=UPI001F4DF0E1|nr:glycosyltransferase [Ancylobacter gelatini]MCJ8142517.1 glycosyl transferase family 28 [Ancylobacter gelatini]